MTNQTSLTGGAGLVYALGGQGSTAANAGLGVDASGNPTVYGASGTVLQTFAGTGTESRVVKASFNENGGTQKVAILNPFAAAAFVERAIVNVTTASSGASTFDLGVAANATTSADNLIDGMNGNSASVYDNVTQGAGTNGKSIQKIGASGYVTLSLASGSATGIVGDIYVTFRKG